MNILRGFIAGALAMPVIAFPAFADERGGGVCKIIDNELYCEDPGEPPEPPEPPVDPIVDPPEEPGEPEPPRPDPGVAPPDWYLPECSPFYAVQPRPCWWPTPPVEGIDAEGMPTTGEAGRAARRAVEELRLPAPDIGSAPCTEDGCMGAVGAPVWLWVNTPWESVTAEASIPGGSISATARPVRTDWDMGDGTTIQCTTGTPYSESYGWAESPDCGHIYQTTSADQPDQRYTITSNLYWVVEVTGDQEFTFVFATRSGVRPAIGEYQSIVVNRG